MSESQQDIHEVALKALHPGDTARVVAGDVTLDPADVLAVWPHTQEDFTGERHADDLFTTEWDHKDHRKDVPGWDTRTNYHRNGIRATFATDAGTRYAAVDWAKTPDPAILYLLVVDADEPESRRWDRVGPLERVERYGPPVDGPPAWVNPSKDVPPWNLETDVGDGDG